MEKIKAYYHLSRPISTITGALAVLLGGYVAQTGVWWPVLLAALVTFIVGASSNAFNDYLDIEIDRINQPQRVLPSGQLAPRDALIFSIVLAAFSIIIGWFISMPAFIIIVTCNALLYIYSWKLKSTVLLGNATIALIASASVFLGGVSAGNVQPSIILATIVATVIMAREILKTMADYEGDLAQQVSTISTVWGMRAAHALFVTIGITALIVLLLPFFVADYNRAYIILTILGLYPVMLYAITKVRANTPAQQLERTSQIIKYAFFVWFFAVWFGRMPI